MAKSSTERSRELRARRKAAQKTATDLATNYLRRPFFEAAETQLDDLGIYWDTIGIDGPWFNDDSGPRTTLGDYESGAEEGGYEAFEGVPKNSLGRAEVLVETLLTIALELTRAINGYKLEEINARIAEIKQADLSDPDAKAKALADIVTLEGIKARLDGKTFRRSFPEYSVKGTYSDQ